MDERSQRNLSVMLQGLASAGQSKVAGVLETSEATISRMKADDLPKVARLLAACGLKVVPVEMQCYDEKTLASILELAQQRMAQIRTPQQLVQDWDKPA